LQQWGERQQIQLKDDWSLLTQEQRRRKADELIAIIRELQQPPMRPPHLVYRAEEAPDEREPVRALSQLDRPLGRKAEGARFERATLSTADNGKGSARSGGLQTGQLGSSEGFLRPHPIYRRGSRISVPYRADVVIDFGRPRF
jgi:hypothetical protein